MIFSISGYGGDVIKKEREGEKKREKKKKNK